MIPLATGSIHTGSLNLLVTMPPARDHKRIFDHDVGPNTGGMGAYAPVPDVSDALIEDIRRTVLQPVIDGMAARGTCSAKTRSQRRFAIR